MARLFALVLLAHTVLAVAALISCLSAEGEGIRSLPRLAWVPAILFVVLLGPIAWFVAGRPAPEGAARWPLRTWPRTNRPVAPDDDAEFLRSLDTRRSQEDRDLFEKWERDLRRREDEQRKNAGDDRRRSSGDEGRRGQGDERPRGSTDDRRQGTGDDLRQQNEEGKPEG
jgi:Phospholipase_D-nuclease N-terminal